MLICELCSKYFTPEEFYEHLKEHSKEEVLILNKLSEKTRKMTLEQYREFLTNLECESYREARDSIEIEERARARAPALLQLTKRINRAVLLGKKQSRLPHRTHV